jgi:mono/diheme cytochrome c family protein
MRGPEYMRKGSALGCLAILTLAPALFGQGSAAIASPDAERALIARYCLGCHSQNAKKAGMEPALRITLDDLDTAHVEKNPEEWERVVRKVRAGMMPPSGLPRPDAATYEAMTAWLETQLDRHAVTHVPPPGLHRMNRTEYANAIRDLLALEIDPSKYLPSDDSTRGFDNIAGALSLSPALLESYVSAAAKISQMAMGRVTAATETVYRVPEDSSQELHIEGMPFRTRGGMKIEHEFPADGEYGFSLYPINKGNMDLDTAFGDIKGEKLDLLIDGERVKLFDWDKDVAHGNAVRNGTDPVKVPLKAGRHTVIVTFIETTQVPGLDLNQHYMRSTIETGDLPGYNFFPQLGKVTISGPFDAKPATDSPSRRKIFACKPANASAETACAKQIVNTLARRAFRRPVANRDTELLMSFYQQGRNTSDNNGSFDQGIEMALNRILADPEFVFRKEVPPAGVKPGEKYRLSDIELASRLSFFLWSSIPDDQLLALAGQNKLHEPAVLEQQVKRMLADPRSDELVTNFAGQWLNLRGLQSQTPTVALFPDFDDSLRQALRTETEMFVDSVVHEDRPVTDLLDADYTFVNERLAKHYGMPDIYGSRFRRVNLGQEYAMRRGLLGKGSILAVSSHPERTMPPIRGKTVMQIFLGVSPPNPPPNVPDLPKSAGTVHGGVKPTMRQQLESHRKVEPCASCHKIMDPIGFSLENFDAIGRWRLTDNGSSIDAAGQLVDGTKLNGVASLRQALLKYSPQFVRVVTEKLMIYALGRGTEYYDMPLIRSIVRDAERNNYKFSSLVLGVVQSEPFQTNMKTATVVGARHASP